MGTRTGLATRNNAEWCDLVCKAHGLATAWYDHAWVCLGDPPPFYPQAVTLVPGTTLTDFPAAPSGFKDSFADARPGADYRKLLDGSWIWREPSTEAATRLEWKAETRLEAWELAWRSGEASDFVQFPPSLVAKPEIVFLGGFQGDQLVAGAILNRSEAVCGVSNVFGAPELEVTVWRDIPVAAGRHFPGVPLVGWEQDPASAVEAGFEVVGPLCVWVR